MKYAFTFHVDGLKELDENQAKDFATVLTVGAIVGFATGWTQSRIGEVVVTPVLVTEVTDNTDEFVIWTADPESDMLDSTAQDEADEVHRCMPVDPPYEHNFAGPNQGVVT